jgi:hypothetical protein
MQELEPALEIIPSHDAQALATLPTFPNHPGDPL